MRRQDRVTKQLFAQRVFWLALVLPIFLGSAFWLFRGNHKTDAAISQQPIKTSDGSRLLLTKADVRSLIMPNGDVRTISSILNVTSPMHYGQFRWNDAGVPSGEIWVRVDLSGQMMSVFRGEHEIGTGVILFGADSHPTPTGRFPVLAKFKDHQSSIYDAKMPYTLRLRGDGVSIHGSNVRQGAATHGCIGIPSAFAARLFEVISIKDPVYILGQSVR